MSGESKDQRRARLNREGKEMIAAGQHDQLTEQHKTAMAYMVRKSSKRASRVIRDRKTAQYEDSGSKGTKATGAGGPRAVKTVSVDPVREEKAYEKLGKWIMSSSEEPGFEKTATLGPERPMISRGAINEDTTHHGVMESIAHHIADNYLEVPDLSGKMTSSKTAKIDESLYSVYDALHSSVKSHAKGQVNDAKVHMQKAANHLQSAVTQLKKRGIEVHPKLHDLIKRTSQSYISSTTPGEGAMPHSKFKPPVERSSTVRYTRPVEPQDHYETGMRSTSSIRTPETSTHLMSRQLLDALGYGKRE